MTATSGDSARPARQMPATWPSGQPGAGAIPAPGGAETAAYLAIAVVALAVRLFGLGAQPLSDAEAAQALVSWRIYQAQPLDGSAYSPLLATLNLAGFFLFGAGDFLARLWPALLGVFLVVLPIGLRRQLGAGGAVTASALLAFSPIAVFLSRTASGDLAALAGALAIVVGGVNWLAELTDSETRATRGRPLVLAAVGVAILLTSAPVAYSIICLFLVFAMAATFYPANCTRDRHRAGCNYLARVIGAAAAAEWTTRRLTYVGVILAAGAIATGLLLNMSGLGAVVDLPGRWVHGFTAPGSAAYLEPRQPFASYPAAFLLGLYEPLILLAGLFGLATALVRRQRFDVFLVWWFLGGLVLDLLRGGRGPAEALVPLVPAVLLAGLALGQLAAELRRDGAWSREGVMAAAGLVVWTYGYVQLMIYTRAAVGVIWLPLAAPGMIILLVLVLWQLQDGISAVRGAALTVIVALLLFTVATTVRLNYAPSALPSQPLAGESAGEGIIDLVETLQLVSTEKVRDPLQVAGVADRGVGAAVEWQLRRFPNLRWVASADELASAVSEGQLTRGLPDVVVASAPHLASDAAFAGQDFVIRNSGQPVLSSIPALVRWVVLRDAQSTGVDRAVLWVKQPDAAAVVP